MYALFSHSFCYIWQFAIDQVSLKKFQWKPGFSMWTEKRADGRTPESNLRSPRYFGKTSKKYLRTKRSQGILRFDHSPPFPVGANNVVGIATRYGLDGPGIESRWGATFSAPVQSVPGAHPASYTIDTPFYGDKPAGSWRWSPTPQLAPRLSKE
jgi:hypothetical protein